MRRIHRGSISLSDRKELFHRSRLSSSKDEAREEWDKYRRSVKSHPVVEALRKAVGVRQRCIYCCDSRSADVDHFVPIAEDYLKAFKWDNFIWVCPECNRRKGKRFPVNDSGDPLIIDPTKVEPWVHLILDTANGLIESRFLEEDFDPMGDATLEVLPCINYESVTEGRRRVIRRYYEALDTVLHGSSAAGFRNVAREIDEDDYGIYAWFALYEGANEVPFSRLRELYPKYWKTFVRLASKR